MRLCVIGAGYVGLVTAACFAEMGNQVRCVERDRERVARLRRGEMPIYEPGLESILRDQLDAARLTSPPAWRKAWPTPKWCSSPSARRAARMARPTSAT